MNALVEAIRRFLRGPFVSRLLRRCAIDPVRYWLLMDLFGTLSERSEMMTQLGHDPVTLRITARIYFCLLGLLSLLLVFGQPPVALYFSIFLAMSAFVLLSVLLSETSNSLVNPVEALVLAHQPIDGATYTAAKLTHLVRVLLYLVPGLSLAPALAGLALKHSTWSYPLLHLAAVFAVGLLVALFCCAFFGWLIRIVPARRLKTAGQVAEMLPWLAFMLFQPLRQFLPRFRFLGWTPAHPAAWVAALAVVAAVLLVLGLRALSRDYLLQVSTIVHGASSRQAAPRRSLLRQEVARVFGGPPARAGFEFVSRLMRRDWQFRRQFLVSLVLLIGPVVPLLRGPALSPFAGPFSAAHMLPHVFGIVLFWACILLPYGSDYKAMWVFHIAPNSALAPFARGVWATLWIKFIAIPHVLLLFLLAWFWGLLDAALFAGYSFAVASLYLALELRLINGVPFGRQPQAARNAFLMPLLIAGGFAIAIVVALQHFLLFRSRLAVGLCVLPLAALAWILARSSFHSLEIAMRYQLSLDAAGSRPLFQELDA
ncbi:MAG TPA: hypothetical protein VG672_12385 [Bryobacteraceae bacterium]|nr:hypothetical protein [Bryobacteraceae bacterium]